MKKDAGTQTHRSKQAHQIRKSQSPKQKQNSLNLKGKMGDAADVHHSDRWDPQELHEASYLFTERAYNVTTTRHMINIFCTIAFTQ
jgi:hypothetical protein